MIQTIVMPQEISKMMEPIINGKLIFISKNIPAKAGPIIFPKLIYALFIPAANPCSCPASLEQLCLQLGE